MPAKAKERVGCNKEWRKGKEAHCQPHLRVTNWRKRLFILNPNETSLLSFSSTLTLILQLAWFMQDPKNSNTRYANKTTLFVFGLLSLSPIFALCVQCDIHNITIKSFTWSLILVRLFACLPFLPYSTIFFCYKILKFEIPWDISQNCIVSKFTTFS